MFRWEGSSGSGQQGDLFALFAALSRGEVESFPALRPHQRQAWHCFLVQCGAMAMIRAGVRDLPTDPARWRELLIGLTPDWPGGDAWELVQEDWGKPALLQPPLAAPTNRVDYKTQIDAADALDMLVTSRNHDVKVGRIRAAADDDWLFALVTLQTMEGFLGAGNYGISRMNGGFASRMALGIQPAGNLSAAFARDVARLVEAAPADARSGKGHAVLWAVSWDGTQQLPFPGLDPLYVDICRRVRLVRQPEGGLHALTAGSKVARVAAAELKGNTGDPWAPIRLADNACVTASPGTFGYRKFTELLDAAKTGRPLLSLPVEGDEAEGLAIVATGLVRGQGKTEGLHRRTIPISRRKNMGRLGHAYLDRMGQVARQRADEAGDVKQMLQTALLAVWQGAPMEKYQDGRLKCKPINDEAHREKIKLWLQGYDLKVDRIFFGDGFWDEFDEISTHPRRDWRGALVAIACEQFGDAAGAAPRTAMRGIRAKAVGLNMLKGALRKYLEDAVDAG